jgi:GntR family transcriptional regulator/MocR family aminotransferase
VLGDQLTRKFGELLSFKLPVGSMAIWAKAAPELDVERWCEAAFERKVAIRPARYFSFDGRSRPFVRLGFAALEERELIEAVKLLAQAAKAIGVSM